jgi:hypothetical protein
MNITDHTAEADAPATATGSTILHPLALPAIGTHWAEQGGVFAGILRGEAGAPDCALIVPTGDAFKLDGEWGEYGQDVAGAKSRTDSLGNTRAMAEAGSKIAAAVLAMRDDEGRDDYAIPSQGASQVLYANVPELFESGWHWTSTQDDRLNAFAQYFTSGSSNWLGKVGEFRVRAVRTIQLHPFIA